MISGTVLGTTDDGAIRLRTQAGELVFRTLTPLPADTPVTLQLGGTVPAGTANAFVPAPGPGAPAAAATPHVPASVGPAAAAPLPAAAAEPPAVTTTLGTLAQAALTDPAGPLLLLLRPPRSSSSPHSGRQSISSISLQDH